jgi:hypothetical protein
MKTTCLLFLTITGATLLMPGLSGGAAESPGSTRPAASERRDHRRASVSNHPPSRANLTKVNRPKAHPNRQAFLPGRGKAINPYPPGSNEPVGVAKGGLIPNKAVHTALPVQTSSVVRPTALPLNKERHRGPNPAVVDGAANLHRSNTGAINGTGINRRP